MRKPTLALVSVLATCLLAACAALQAPESFNERMAYAVSTHTAIVTEIGNAAAAGAISPEEGDELLDTAEQARALMDSARRIEAAGDGAAAARQLTLALAVLAELQRYTQEE